MSIDGLLNKALVTSRMGSFSPALDAVKEALAIDPESRRAHRVLAIVLLRKGDPWEAETALLATGPVADAEGVQLHAKILVRTGRHREAIDRAREAVRMAPESAEAHHNLGQLLHAVASHGDERFRPRRRVGRTCVTHWEEAIGLAPEHLPPRVSMARHVLAAGDPRTARRLIDECLAIDPAHVDARLLAAQLCWRAGDWEAARGHAEWLLANAGSHETALTLLNQTRLPAGALIRPVQRLAFHIRGRSIWLYLALLLGLCAVVSGFTVLGVKPPDLAFGVDRLPLGPLLGTFAAAMVAVRFWPRWQASRALRAPDLSQDF